MGLSFYASGQSNALALLGLSKQAAVSLRPTAANPHSKTVDAFTKALAEAKTKKPSGFGSVNPDASGLFSKFERPSQGSFPRKTIKGEITVRPGEYYPLRELPKTAEWDGQDYATAAGTAALAAPLAYMGLRRFKPSSNPVLRELQMKAKDQGFEVATHAPTGSRVGRGIRRVMYGAPDISDAVHDAARKGERLKRDATVLHHGSPFSQLPVEGNITLNAPEHGLAPAMADKGSFANVFNQVQEQLPEGVQAIPKTRAMGEALAESRGDIDQLRRRSTDAMPEGFLIKPTDESLGDVQLVH